MSSAAHLIPLPAPRRSLHATLLFTDIVGSTRHAVELGDEAWREILERQDACVRREVARAGGRVVKNLGDGYLLSFDDPHAAVACAHTLVAGARGEGFELRAGLHSGEVQVFGDDLVGIAVHIAARVCSLAEPGSVLATAAVSDPAREDSASLIDRGLQELRHVPGRFRLFEAVSHRPVLSLC